MILATTSRQAVWYLNEFTHPGYTINITIMADNICSSKVPENSITNAQTKHFDHAYHDIREHRICKRFTLSYVASNDDTADPMAKGLNSVAHIIHTPHLVLSE